MGKLRKSAKPSGKDSAYVGFLTSFAASVFSLPKTVFIAWVVVVVFGAVSYTTLLKREGFPSVNIPITIVSGTYIGSDAATIDQKIAKPISDLALSQDNIASVEAQSADNFTSIVVQYRQGTDSKQATTELEKLVNDRANLPDKSKVEYRVPHFGPTGGSAEKIDATISFYSIEPTDIATIASKGQEAVNYLNKHKPDSVSEFFLQSPFGVADDPQTGRERKVQRTFDRLGVNNNGKINHYNSVIIGATGKDNADVIKLDSQLQGLVSQLNNNQDFKGFNSRISASFAPSIKGSISELQRVLIEGLLAVLVVGSIIITIRASLITVISMITVIASTLAVLYAIGYSLNVITLFALILGLSLVVDDTIIMTEAVEAAKRQAKTPLDAIRRATSKISRAMVAATLTAAASFLPLVFVGGIIGNFIRAVPVTIIISLAISLLVALVFIPMFARVILLKDIKSSRRRDIVSTSVKIESKIAHGLTWPMRWAKGSSRRLIGVGSIAVVAGLVAVAAAGLLFSKLTFNIFPPSKDSNGLAITLVMPSGSTLEQAENYTAKANDVISRSLGSNFVASSNYGQATAQSVTINVDLTPYGSREVTAKELSDKLQSSLDDKLPSVTTNVSQVDVGPPAAEFSVQIKSDDARKSARLAESIAAYMQKSTIMRLDGSTANFKDISFTPANTVARSDGQVVTNVTARFNAEDTTTLMNLSRTLVQKEFNESKLAEYGLDNRALGFDMGQESDNQKSFSGLLVAFPVVLLIVFLLLSLEFRSLLQPLLVFLAIPFSLLGVALGLYLSNNALSFFSVMGFFALIGLSIKNTILLVDYANQSRKRGLGPVDSVIAALQERFRPLIATSLTAVVSLIPLALTSPFWQGLAVVLIGGLLSSTLLVITVFPYYYLAGEFLKNHISVKSFMFWLVSSVGLFIVLFRLNPSSAVPLTLIFMLVYPIVKLKLDRAVKGGV